MLLFGEMSSLTKKCMAVEKEKGEVCARAAVQQMCHLPFLVFLWPAFRDDSPPLGWSKKIPSSFTSQLWVILVSLSQFNHCSCFSIVRSLFFLLSHTPKLSIPAPVPSVANPFSTSGCLFSFICLFASSPSPSLFLFVCSEGKPCQCVVCQCGNNRGHRGPFTEAKIKTGRQKNTSMFTLTAKQP